MCPMALKQQVHNPQLMILFEEQFLHWTPRKWLQSLRLAWMNVKYQVLFVIKMIKRIHAIVHDLLGRHVCNLYKACVLKEIAK